MKTHHWPALAAIALVLSACANPATTGTPANTPVTDPVKTGGNTVSAHDGTPSAPVALTLGTPFSGKVGAASDLSNSESYYSFHTGSETSVVLELNQSSPVHSGSLDWDLRVYTDAAMTFANQVDLWSPNDSTAPYLTGLTPSTTYYVKLFNKVDTATTFKVQPRAAASLWKHDGSITPSFAPIVLFFLGTNTATTHLVVTSVTNEDVSYYAFTAPASGTATISYPDGYLDGTLYPSQSYAGLPEGWESSYSAKSFTAPVTMDKGYYLKIKHWGTTPTRVTGTLTVTIQ